VCGDRITEWVSGGVEGVRGSYYRMGVRWCWKSAGIVLHNGCQVVLKVCGDRITQWMSGGVEGVRGS